MDVSPAPIDGDSCVVAHPSVVRTRPRLDRRLFLGHRRAALRQSIRQASAPCSRYGEQITSLAQKTKERDEFGSQLGKAAVDSAVVRGLDSVKFRGDEPGVPRW